MEQIRRYGMCPDGIKSTYLITLNDLLSKDFLKETTLVGVTQETFHQNWSKRVNKMKEVASCLGAEIDFGAPFLRFEVAHYNLNKLIQNFLPHLI